MKPVSLLLALLLAASCIKAQETTLLFSCDSIPKVFTPNGDGKGDRFLLNPAFVAGIEPDSFHLRIFNRYGQLVGESRDPHYSWEGKDTKGKAVPGGMYPYIIRVLFRDGQWVDCKGMLALVY